MHHNNDYQIDGLIEAKMWLLSNTDKDTLLNEIESYDNNIELFNLFGVTTEEELIADIGEGLEELGYNLEDWFVEANRRVNYRNKHKLFFNKSQGFPLDVPCLYKILNNRYEVCHLAASEANQVLPGLYSLSRYKKTILRNDKVLYEAFPERENESPSEIFDSLKTHSIYDKLYLANSTLKSLMGKTGDGIQGCITDTYFVKGGVRVLESKTGRDNPKPSEGFILNCHTWMRHIIKPRPGKAFIKLDWVAQEPWIAGILTGDADLIEGYKSDDLYSYVGKKLNLMPLTGDKYSYPRERQIAKDLQLAVSYGQGVKGLSKKIDNAEHLLSKHKATFKTYWDWVQDNISKCKKQGYYRSIDGWLYFVNKNTPDYLLYNAPFQIEAAGLMREFVLLLDEDIDLVATHFDAVYVNCDDDKVDVVSKRVEETMNNAAKRYFKTELYPIAKPEIFRFPSRFTDSRGTEFFNKVITLIH